MKGGINMNMTYLTIAVYALIALSITSYYIEESCTFPCEVSSVAGVLKWVFMIASYIPMAVKIAIK